MIKFNILKTKILASALPILSLGLSTYAYASCQVDYDVTNDWGAGAQINVRVTNTGSSAIDGYQLIWDAPQGESLDSGWNASLITLQSGRISASNPAGHWNGLLSANGGSSAFGLMIKNTAAPADKVSVFTLNGTICQSGPAPSPMPSSSPTPSPIPAAKPNAYTPFWMAKRKRSDR